MAESDLDPMDPRIEPLAQAIGRAVLAAAALERVLLVDIARRSAEREGLSKGLEAQLARLETRPAGALLSTLRALGISSELACRIQDVIWNRNQLVHRFMEDPTVMLAFVTGAGVPELVERVDRLAVDCQNLVNELGGPAFAGLEEALGATLPELLAALRTADLDAIEDERLRTQLKAVRAIDAQAITSIFRHQE